MVLEAGETQVLWEIGGQRRRGGPEPQHRALQEVDRGRVQTDQSRHAVDCCLEHATQVEGRGEGGTDLQHDGECCGTLAQRGVLPSARCVVGHHRNATLRRTVGVTQAAPICVQHDERPVFPPASRLQRRRNRLAHRHRIEPAQQRLAVVARGTEIEKHPAQEFSTPVPEQRFERRVAVGDHAIAIGRADPVSQHVEQTTLRFWVRITGHFSPSMAGGENTTTAREK